MYIFDFFNIEGEGVVSVHAAENDSNISYESEFCLGERLLCCIFRYSLDSCDRII